MVKVENKDEFLDYLVRISVLKNLEHSGYVSKIDKATYVMLIRVFKLLMTPLPRTNSVFQVK